MSFFGKTQVNIPLHELVSKMPTYSNIETIIDVNKQMRFFLIISGI